MYLYEGVHLLSVAATEIQNSEVLWREDRTAVTLKSRDGILEPTPVKTLWFGLCICVKNMCSIQFLIMVAQTDVPVGNK